MNIGKSVHFVSYPTPEAESKCQSGIITEEGILGDETTASTGKAGVAVMTPTGTSYPRNVPYVELKTDVKPTPGSWHWLEEHEEKDEE